MSVSQSFCARGSGRFFKQSGSIFFSFVLLLLGLIIPATGLASTFESGLEQFEKQRRQVARQMEEATLWVLVIGDNESENSISVGSCFMVADGYAMTNGHVVEGARQIYVGNSRLPMVRAKVVGVDYKSNSDIVIGSSDFALLRFSTPRNLKLPILSFSLELARTDRVSAWGYPMMVTRFDESINTLRDSSSPQEVVPPPIVYTEGTVNSIVKRKHACIVHSAAIAGGNSGGPLVNWRGQVVGMNTWGYTEEDEGAFLNVSLTSPDILAFLTRHGIKPSVVQPDWEKALKDQDNMANTVAAAGQEGASFLDIVQGGKKTGDGGVTIVPDQTAVNNQNRDPRLKHSSAREQFAQAVKGDARAQGRVGASYLHGQYGFPYDLERAWHWLTLAAEQGDSLGQGFLGTLYLLDPEARDTELAMELLRASADAEDAVPDIQAFLGLALYAFKAYGVEPDFDESLEWAEIAAESGSMLGKALCGMHYYDGAVMEPDFETAYALAQESAQAEVPMGKTLLALLYYNVEGYDAELEHIIDLAVQAAETGEVVAHGLLAKIFAFEEDSQDLVAAERWARRAADMADPVGQFVLGWLYLNGQVVDQSDAMAWAYLSLADEGIIMAYDRDDPLLAQLEKRISPADKRQGQEIKKTWLREWGLEEE